MTILTHANLYYGQLRGYDRLSITARVNAALRATPEEVRRQQLLDFRKIVSGCIGRFPSYADKVRRHTGSLPGAKDRFVPTDLPLWTKRDQRELFSSLDPDEFRNCILHASGGSTGVPVQFYMTRHSYEWRTAVAKRSYRFAGAEPGRRTLYVWSDSATQQSLGVRLKARLNHWVDNRRHFNCFFFNAERKQRCCEAINRQRPTALVGYAGKLVELAAYCRAVPGVLKWRTPNIITAAEGLQQGQRELLMEHLGEHVFMSYGSREFMSIGMESRHACGYHLADDNLLVEVVDEFGTPVKAGESGQIVVTDLRNTANPFIRYVIGDLGVMADDNASCPGGLPFRRLLEVQGRNQEFVHTPDGQRLTLIYFAHNLKEFPWIEAFQIVQRSLSHLVIRVLSSQPVTADLKRIVRQQLKPKLGTALIDVEQVDALSRRSNGKVAVLISELAARRAADAVCEQR